MASVMQCESAFTSTLGDVADINPSFDRSQMADKNELVSFLPMANVSEQLGIITEETYRPGNEVLKGFTPFKDRDVLVAKITPCFENGKIAHARISQRFGFGSTEFHVVRPHPDVLNDRYLFQFLRRDRVRVDGERNMTGSAGQRRVPKRFLQELSIPLPPLPEQRRIAAILDKADALRQKRREAIAKLDQLLQSVFLEMFGDPVANPMGWPKASMGELMRIRRGGSPRPIGEFLGGEHHWVKIGDATQGDDVYITQTKEKIISAGLRKTVQLKAGSLVFANCGVSLGFARILKIDGCIHDGWLAFDKVDESRLQKLFLLKALNGVTRYFRDTAPSGTQPNLNTGIMKRFQIILPPPKLQERFESAVKAINYQRLHLVSALGSQDDLFASIQQRAFTGQL